LRFGLLIGDDRVEMRLCEAFNCQRDLPFVHAGTHHLVDQLLIGWLNDLLHRGKAVWVTGWEEADGAHSSLGSSTGVSIFAGGTTIGSRRSGSGGCRALACSQGAVSQTSSSSVGVSITGIALRLIGATIALASVARMP